MFRKKTGHLKEEFDERLLRDIDQAFLAWNNAKRNQATVYEPDGEMEAQTKAAKAQCELLYREARIRKVKGHLQSTVISQ